MSITIVFAIDIVFGIVIVESIVIVFGIVIVLGNAGGHVYVALFKCMLSLFGYSCC